MPFWDGHKYWEARDSETRGFPSGDGDHRTQYAGANAAHRRFARFEPNHGRSNSPRRAADWQLSMSSEERSNRRSRPPKRKASAWKAYSIPRSGNVSGDPARLQQMFWNLLSNAIKFTPKGGKVQVLLQRINSHIEIQRQRYRNWNPGRFSATWCLIAFRRKTARQREVTAALGSAWRSQSSS